MDEQINDSGDSATAGNNGDLREIDSGQKNREYGNQQNANERNFGRWICISADFWRQQYTLLNHIIWKTIFGVETQIFKV